MATPSFYGVEQRAIAPQPSTQACQDPSLDSKQWLAVRKRGIGSSDFAATVGLNPYKSQLQLWMEKTGRDAGLPKIDPEDDGNEASGSKGQITPSKSDLADRLAEKLGRAATP